MFQGWVDGRWAHEKPYAQVGATQRIHHVSYTFHEMFPAVRAVENHETTRVSDDDQKHNSDNNNASQYV